MSSPDSDRVSPEFLEFLPRSVRELPLDLTLVVIWVFLTGVTSLVPPLNETLIRVVVAIPFVVFVPGYVTVATLFPESKTARVASTNAIIGGEDGIDCLERLALSVALSVAISPLVALLLSFSSWGVGLPSLLVSLGGYSLALTGLALYRRRQLPASDRFHVSHKQYLNATKKSFSEVGIRTDFILSIALGLSLIFATVSVGYAVSSPSDVESFTELSILMDEGEGELVASNYPNEIIEGRTQPLVVQVRNHEHRRINYTLVVQLEDLRAEDGEVPTAVERREELHRSRISIAHNETYHQEVTLQPNTVGNELRLSFLLFKEEAPTAPSRTSAYRGTSYWLNVTPQ